MSDDAVRELLAGYALGALSSDEAQIVERHLPTCERCRRELAEFRMVAGTLDEFVPLREAPAHLEADLRARLAASRVRPRVLLRRGRRVGRLLPAALAAVAIVGGLVYALVDAYDLTARRKADAILLSADAMRVTLVADDTGSGIEGEIVFDSDSSIAAVSLNSLPPLPRNQVYQLWLVAGDERDDGGTYRANELLWLVRTPRMMNAYDAVGVTIEPAGGVPAPTGPRVFGARLTSSS